MMFRRPRFFDSPSNDRPIRADVTHQHREGYAFDPRCATCSHPLVANALLTELKAARDHDRELLDDLARSAAMAAWSEAISIAERHAATFDEVREALQPFADLIGPVGPVGPVANPRLFAVDDALVKVEVRVGDIRAAQDAVS